ncbi:CotO family spore coat protein [Mesobacillus subterraneus]|uniref:CotO family spore coat protein n=1 Tax=Mesobacillus subterraneus TaxID=285983 RepID=UPI001CFD4640|nr:CotO family spore coat protein [Mesobacillus subterraneus]WLR53810.1 CotO family spore coat protein [Mesobacillus subterraneus]
MARRKKRLNPLLYIDQRTYGDVSTSMQEKFIFDDREQIEEVGLQQNEKGTGDIPVTADSADIKMENREDETEETEKKPFKDMSITEKIDYLEQFPASIVKIQYSFITTENKFVGYFLSKDEEYIRIFPRNKRKPISILINEIKDIKISGL